MKARKLGLLSSTSLVVGNMIGSGIFMLPASLAIFGGLSLVAWILAAIGALLLAYVFKNLSKLVPHANGGPYAYTKEGLGDFPAFLVAWGYWISIWCTNAAIAVAFVSYLSVFIPSLANNFFYSAIAGLSVIWLLTWFNTRKIVYSGRLQTITTVLKITPLILISIVGIFLINTSHFVIETNTVGTHFNSLTSAVTLCLFAFLGLESATIPSDSVKDQQKTIPRATMIGTSIAILIYILSSITVMGLIPPETLKHSAAPFADAAQILWGEKARYLIAIGALISTFGALNGWILLQGQVPMAVAKDQLFPSVFKRTNKNHMPTMGLIISSILASLVMLLNFTKGFAETFKFILLLSTLTSLLPYLFSISSYLLVLLRNKEALKIEKLKLSLAFFALLFVFWAIAGSGEETVYWGFLLLIAGIPFYIWFKRNH